MPGFLLHDSHDASDRGPTMSALAQLPPWPVRRTRTIRIGEVTIP
jgi:hypothetical protein